MSSRSEPTTPLADVVAAQAESAPERVWATSVRGERTLDRAELAALVAAWARQPVAGRRIALSESDPVAFAGLFVALVAAGATLVPLDPHGPADARRQLMTTAGARALVSASGAPDDLHAGVGVVVADPLTLHPVLVEEDRGEDVVDDGGASLLFSSGSTGVRKAMRLPQEHLLHVARAVAGAHDLGPDDRCLNPLPLFHVNAEVVALLATLVSGSCVVLDDRFHRTGFWDAVQTHRITWVNAVPAIIAILAREAADPAPGPHLRFVRSASAPLAVPVLERFEKASGARVVETYGMTEAASQITANPLDDPRPGTVGRPVGVELEVRDETGNLVPTGEVGRVHLRGGGVIDHYEGDVGADRFDAHGWLDTGDMGSLDADGYLTLAGRSDDIINRGGEKIFPREVEEVLRTHPDVAESVVVGRPHDVLGQVPVAYVIAGPGIDASDPAASSALADDLTARCARALPRAHRPVELHVVDDLPLGPTGKLSRRLVAERVDAPAAETSSAHG